MKFASTRVEGAYVLEPQPSSDSRGSFSRIWCARELEAHGLDPRMAQASTSFNVRRGTLRGMHYQRPPSTEAKFVRCIRGAIYDVVLDLRPSSSTYCTWDAVELTADNRLSLFVPAGCAHGFQTLADDTEVLYLISAFYDAAADEGVRWNDPAFGIAWPFADPILSDRDRAFADFARCA